jgi:hypothetical protein
MEMNLMQIRLDTCETDHSLDSLACADRFDEFGTAEALGEIPKRNWATRVAKSSAQSEDLGTPRSDLHNLHMSGQLWTWALSWFACVSPKMCFPRPLW